MSLKISLYDTVKGHQVAGQLYKDIFGADQDFVSTGQTDFVVGTITSTQKIDVYVNGRMMREGGSYDFLRNVGTSKIIFNYTVPADAWIRVRVYPE